MDICSFILKDDIENNPEINEAMYRNEAARPLLTYSRHGIEIYIRTLESGYAVFAFNKEPDPRIIYIDFEENCIAGSYSVRDIIKREDKGLADKEVYSVVGGNGYHIFRLNKLR